MAKDDFRSWPRNPENKMVDNNGNYTFHLVLFGVEALWCCCPGLDAVLLFLEQAAHEHMQSHTKAMTERNGNTQL